MLDLAGDRVPVLVCYEGAGSRGALVSPRSGPRAGCSTGSVSRVREYGLEGCGCGWHHPKLHQAKRERT